MQLNTIFIGIIFLIGFFNFFIDRKVEGNLDNEDAAQKEAEDDANKAQSTRVGLQKTAEAEAGKAATTLKEDQQKQRIAEEKKRKKTFGGGCATFNAGNYSCKECLDGYTLMSGGSQCLLVPHDRIDKCPFKNQIISGSTRLSGVCSECDPGYELVAPGNAKCQKKNVKCKWTLNAISPCTEPCGGGTQFQSERPNAGCVDDNGQLLEPRFKFKDKKCNEDPCPQGKQGETGRPGEEGDPGIRGVRGQAGKSGGAAGDVGPHGYQGEQGPPGLRGPSGPIGEKGPRGDSGIVIDRNQQNNHLLADIYNKLVKLNAN